MITTTEPHCEDCINAVKQMTNYYNWKNKQIGVIEFTRQSVLLGQICSPCKYNHKKTSRKMLKAVPSFKTLDNFIPIERPCIHDFVGSDRKHNFCFKCGDIKE